MGATTRLGARMGVLVAGLALVVGANARGADDQALRDELLNLNQATTEDLQNAKFRALMKDRAKAKKAVAEAVKMMKEAGEKEKPFNYNATLHPRQHRGAAEKLPPPKVRELVGRAGDQLKSGKKIVDSHINLIDPTWTRSA